MIRLHPAPDAAHDCPRCHVRLETAGWCIPGMRNLADLQCPQCHAEYFGDLPSGQALYTPLLLEKATGHVHDSFGVPWFSGWLGEGFKQKAATEVDFHVEQLRPLRRVVLLNCLDAIYGHSILKLLNAQYYLDQKPNWDLVVLVPPNLRWLVPDGCAAVWTATFRGGNSSPWSESLASQIQAQLAQVAEVWLSVAYSHPHPDDVDIARFTRVTPFIRRRRGPQGSGAPTVTFVARDDRPWVGSLSRWLDRRTFHRAAVGLRLGDRWVLRLATQLQRRWPEIDMAVTGQASPGRLPGWIKDWRRASVDEQTERMWCERAGVSDLVVGVHGSHLLLPSALAGATVELMPFARWGNVLQDLLVSTSDQRETLWRYRILPWETGSRTLATILLTYLNDVGLFELNMGRDTVRHERGDFAVLSRMRRRLSGESEFSEREQTTPTPSAPDPVRARRAESPGGVP